MSSFLLGLCIGVIATFVATTAFWKIYYAKWFKK